MIRHIVLFKLNPGADEQTISRHMSDFAALEASISAIATIEVQRDFAGREVSADFGLIVSFVDDDALKAYQAHPEHQAAFGRLKPHLERMLLLDYRA